jgi:GNAT superfamily N-acetyltransferase
MNVPDLPRWVEAHGIAADPDGWRERAGGGEAIGHDAARLIVITGEADVGEVMRVRRPGYTCLFAIERDDLAAAFPRTSRAILHTLPDPDRLPDLDGVALLGDAQLPARADDALAAEIRWARTRGPVWSAWVDGEPVSFAYAPWRSPAWFDVSVDTLPDARQLGLATTVAAAMIRDERTRGREPVWGADEANVASLRLAKRLGFEAIDEIWVAPP